jgi:NADH-quinone oxidoreductase subunit I
MPALKGVGLLKGLGVTLKTMTRPAATRQYPHVKPDLPARSRGVIALIEENCTVCMLCSRECPDWCIYIDSHKEVVAPKEGGRARTRNILDRFAIDYALCMYCGICVEVCPFDALHWSPEFEYAEYQIDKLTHEMDTLRTWAYTVPAPDPLEEGAVEPREVESARKAREAVVAKAAAAAGQAQAQAEAATAAPAAPAAAAAAPGSVETPAAAVAAPETAAPAPAAAGTPEAAEPAADARDPEARTPEGEPTASATAVEVAPGAAVAQADAEHLEIEIDQETYDRLIAAGEPERTARARAKAAYARKLRAAQRGQS